MNLPSTRTLAIVGGAILAVPVALVVVLPLVVTFLTWLVRVPGVVLGTILPGGER